jgi:hypothetical protein
MAAALAASAALSAGSALASNAANDDVYSAQNAAIQKMRERDQALASEAQGIFGRSLDRAQKPAQDERLNEALTKRTQSYSKAISPSHGSDLPGDNPSVVSGEASRAMASADRSTAQQAKAKAKLDSFGDLSLGNAIDSNHNMNLLQMLANFRRGNQAILPIQLQAAQSRGGGKRTLSDLLRMGSQVASAYGAAGAPTPDWFTSSVPLNAAGFRMTGAGPLASLG